MAIDDRTACHCHHPHVDGLPARCMHAPTTAASHHLSNTSRTNHPWCRGSLRSHHAAMFDAGCTLLAMPPQNSGGSSVFWHTTQACIAPNLAIELPPRQLICNGRYDFQKLHDVTKVVAYHLNKIIDVNYYPVPEARHSNIRHRPIGVGVQGLADAFMALCMPFDLLEAKELNIQIFETIYHAAFEASAELAERDGQLLRDLDRKPCSTRPASEKIVRTGLRNTASMSQILLNNKCFESNIYTCRALAGEFQVVCPWLLHELVDFGLWDDNMKNMIIAHNGSIQNIPTTPDDVKTIYKTVWEIDLTRSWCLHLPEPDGWKQGLKSGMYYLRTRPAA
ncbi:hypothetical protein BDZ97DRAFT_1925625 [Flammula alnicola]|nr:hypothetical protein BDZ97DRAFT_1925625 [Flammula alnicola]